MEVRNPLPNEKNLIINLWKYCFNNDTEKFIEHYFQNIYKEENTLVVLDHGKILTSVQINPYSFSVFGNIFDTKYIVGISSFPEARGQRAVNLLFNEIFQKLYIGNTPFIILMAIDYGLYEPYGFAHVYDKYIIKGTLKSLNQKIKDKGDFYPLSTDSDKNLLQKVVDFHNSRLNETKNIYCSRTYENFKNNLRELKVDNGYAYYLKENEEIKGYLFYYFNNNSLVVKEILYNDTNDLQKILKFLYNHNTQFSEFEIREDHHELINEFVENRRELKTELMPFLSVRIINLLDLFKKLNFGQYFEQPFKLKVNDQQIANNNAVFLFEKNKTISILNIDEPEGKNYDLEIDISLLTQLIFEYLDSKTALKLVKYYKTTGSFNKDIFFNIFKQKQSLFFNEYV